MSWLHPGLLWLLPLAALPFFLRRPDPPARRVVVSALHLWPAVAAPAAPAPRASPIRLTPQACLQATVLALLVGALARPVFSAGGAAIVLIVDVSASMAGPAGTVSRLDAGRRLALAALGEVAGARVRVLEAGASVRDTGVMRAGSDTLGATLGAMDTQATGADLDSALSTAAVLEPGAHTWVVSDHVVPGASRTLHAETPAGNLAVTALVARAEPSGDATTVMVQLENLSTAAARARFTLLGGGQSVLEEPVSLAPHGTLVLTRRIAAAPPTLEARLSTDQADGLAVDNMRVAVVEPRTRVVVTFAGLEGAFVRKALLADDTVSIADGIDPAADVTICAGCGEGPARPGGLLRVPAGGAPVQARARVRVVAPAHPLAAGLAGLTATAAPTGENAEGEDAGGEVILRAGTNPLVTAEERAEGRVVTFHGSIDDTVFGSSALFAVLVANAVDWLSASDNPRSITAGTSLSWWVGGTTDATSDVTLTGPDGQPRQAQVTAGWLNSRDTATPGIYTVHLGGSAAGAGAAGEETLPLAVTPATAEESDLGTVTAGDTPARAPVPAGLRAGRELTPWVLAAALLMLGLEWRTDGQPRARVGLVLRVACGAALLLAAAGLRVPTGSAPVAVVYALDRSGSVPLRDQRAALSRGVSQSQSTRRGDTAGLVTFAGRPLVRRQPSGAVLPGDAGAEPDPGNSNIEQAMRAAIRLVPHDGTGRVVLVSDGHETSGRATDAARDAADAKVAIDTIPAGVRTPLPSVRALYAPADARAGEPFPVEVVLAGPAGLEVEVTLEPRQAGGRAPEVRRVTVGADGSAVTRFIRQASEPGLAVYRAHLGPDADPDGPGVAVSILGPPRALHVTATAGAGRPPLPVPAPAFVVSSVTADRLPVHEIDLDRYQLVLLDGVPGEALGAAAGAALARFVERGGGLVVLGTPESLPPGGYAHAAVDALLPVDLRAVPGSRTAEAATVVAVDKSGSMSDTVGGLQKMEAARDAVRQVVQVLGPTVALGVLAFDVRASAVAALAARPDGRALDAALRAIEPGGATRIAPAAEMAAAWLTASGAARRHLLLVSDGRSTTDDLARVAVVARETGITVSVIAIGADADRPALTALAGRTGGRAYFPERLNDLPRLAARDVVQSRGGTTVTESVTLRAPGTHPVLGGLNTATLPRLNGYVVTAARPGAEPILESSLADPVLIARRTGLGRVVIFTGDLTSTWSAPLRQWSGYATLFAQTLRWTSRRDTANGMDAAIEETAQGARLVVDALPSHADITTPLAAVMTPDGRREPLVLRPEGLTRFAAVMPDGPPGLYRVEVVMTAGGDERRVVRALLRPADRERLGQGVNDDLLRRLAATTGGRVLPEDGNPFDVPRPIGFTAAAPALTAMALALALVIAGGGRWPRRQRRPPDAAGAGQVAA